MLAELAQRRALLGVMMIVVMVAAAVAVAAGHFGAFTSYVRASVRLDRAGLLLDPGSDVVLRGVNVGKVLALGLRGENAVLDVGLDPDQVRHIPANVRASIEAPTVFGTKYVALHLPPRPTARRIADGDVITAGPVSVESKDLLRDLNTLLTSVDVAKLNSALGGLSTSLQGRGDKLGRLLVQLNTYLVGLNPTLPTLNRDLAKATDVVDTFADVTPDLVRILDNVSVTSRTLVHEKPRIPHLLSSAIEATRDARTLLDHNGNDLAELLDTLRPTTGLLARYSPESPCLFASLNQLRVDLQPAIGGVYPGLRTFSTFLPGAQGYRFPRDLPKVGPTTPPSCFGGPISPADAPFPHVLFDDGTHTFVPGTDRVSVTPTSPVANPLPRPLRTLTRGTR